jgi:hypothetical protein
MRVLAVVLAVVLGIIGVLYGLGTINWFTQSGSTHGHHVTHLVVAWALALLCLIWARFQSAPRR